MKELGGGAALKACIHCHGNLADFVETCPYCGAAQPVPQTAVAWQGWQAPRNSNKAIASLVCGVLFMCAPASIAAIVLGHLALLDIKRAAGRMAGKGLAIAGLVLGYTGIGLTTLYFAFVFFLVRNTFSRDVPANETAAIATMKTYQAALNAYAQKCDAQGYPASLSLLGPGNGDCTRANLIRDRRLAAAAPVAKGYTFEYRPGANGAERVSVFVLVARPMVPGGTGKRFFYLDESGVLREASTQNVGPQSPPVGTSGRVADAPAPDEPAGSEN
jgi:RNA polymerase subunit RPABC4/transcription elongation factor Spt4